MLGADGGGKAEASLAAVTACGLFCDEWEQASHGGELAGAAAAGAVTREQVAALGAVLAGDAPGRSGPDAITLFDSTGLAIQDLAVAAAALRAAQARAVRAGSVTL
jgi:alanine dehydrogenase